MHINVPSPFKSNAQISTPKIMQVTDSTGPHMHVGAKYDSDYFFQLSGEAKQDPNEVEFALNH